MRNQLKSFSNPENVHLRLLVNCYKLWELFSVNVKLTISNSNYSFQLFNLNVIQYYFEEMQIEQTTVINWS